MRAGGIIALIGLCAAGAAYLHIRRQSRDDIGDDITDWSDPTLPPQARSPLPRTTVAGAVTSRLGDILLYATPSVRRGRTCDPHDGGAWDEYVNHGGSYGRL